MPTEGGRAADLAGIEARILDFVHRELLAPGERVGRDDDLLSERLDSVAALRLATFAAEAFEVEIRPADYVLENFQTVALLARFVDRASRR